MDDPIVPPRGRLRLFRTVRMLGPSLASLVLAGMLVFTILFTAFDWQWIAFLSGILFAAVLSLITSSWKAEWGMAQSAEQVVQMRERLAVETVMHRQTSERLDREQTLHQQDRERRAMESEAIRVTAEHLKSAEAALRMLELHLPAAACVVDGDMCSRFHTRAFAALIGRRSAQIDGHLLSELFATDAANALGAAVVDAQVDGVAHAEFSISEQGSMARKVIADLVAHRGGSGKVTGYLVTFREAGAALPPASVRDAIARHEDAIRDLAAGLRVTDETGHAVYLRSLTEELTGWSDSRARIREAIDQDRFDLHAQDIVPLRPGLRPPSMREVLIRMRHEEEHNLPPGAFFPAAEHFGLMPDIDRWVVKKIVAACAAVATARRAELPLLCINVARSSMEDRSFGEFVAGTLAQHDVSGNHLCFEMADNDVIAAIADALRFADEVKRLGCHLSLDGFGSAGVGFDHVKSLPLDFLKIDGRIILAVTRDPVALAKVNAIGRVCRGIGVRTIAEMVESEEVRRKLASLEVDYAQGFGIARPCPLGALV